ncbi:MAG: hypothetical protein AAB336_14010 [Acidobacteriota bacterium]
MNKLFKISLALTFIFALNYLANAQAKKTPTPNDPIRACGKAIFQGHPNEKMQVSGAISAIKTKCRKGALVDEKNKPLKIVQNYCSPGIPPREGDGRELIQKKHREAIEKLKKKYRVITYNCYPPRP